MTVAGTREPVRWRDHRSGSASVDELVGVLDLDPDGAGNGDSFTGHSTATPQGRIFGGQTLAQSLVAAARTVVGPVVPHSLQAAFLQPGDPAAEIGFTVRPLRDSRSFRTRRVDTVQHGRLICTATVSFHIPEAGLDHADPLPHRRPPEDLEPRFPFQQPGSADPGPIEQRKDSAVPDPAGVALWMRVTAPLPDDPLLHTALLVYLSDFGILHGAYRLHGVRRSLRRTASLDHAMWLHRPARADGWLHYDTRSPTAVDGRALGTGTFHAATGELLATATQEMIVRGRRG
ncbi:MAG: thioesterase family protein [Pseudonocardia sp.]|nr:thioesterase family protein [Pseudonocardia sp.]